MKNNDILIEQTSDNVFADLGYANAEEALLKSNLAQAIVEVIEQQKLSEVDVFTRLGINSLMLSKLKRGQLRELKTGDLFRFLHLLNQDVEIISRTAESRTSIVRNSLLPKIADNKCLQLRLKNQLQYKEVLWLKQSKEIKTEKGEEMILIPSLVEESLRENNWLKKSKRENTLTFRPSN